MSQKSFKSSAHDHVPQANVIFIEKIFGFSADMVLFKSTRLCQILNCKGIYFKINKSCTLP